MSELTKAEQQKKELFYDPFPDCAEDGCDGCDKQNCGQREEATQECDFTGEECIDEHLRLYCGCVGCEMLAPPPEAKLPVCPYCDLPMDEEGELNGETAYTCKKCKRIIKCTRDHIEKLWEDLCGPKPLGLIDSVNQNNAVHIQSTEEQKEPTK